MVPVVPRSLAPLVFVQVVPLQLLEGLRLAPERLVEFLPYSTMVVQSL
jgi:hypothetical protein